MLKLSINTTKSQFPLKISKGTPEQRIQKAIEYSDKFFENIKDSFVKGDISAEEFTSIIRKTAGEKIGIETLQSSNNGGMICRNYNENKEQIGYALFLPFNPYSQKISKMTTKTFMHEIFHFFDHLLNPKYNKRIHNLINKGYDTYSIGDFYNKKIYTKENLNIKTLNEFLKKRSVEEQIDCLQFFRYSLKLEQNAYKNTTKYQRLIENYYTNSISYHEPPHRYGKYKFNTKIKILEKMLAKIINTERSKLKTL